MKRFYRLFVSLLIVVGIVAVAPATTVTADSDQQCISQATGCSSDALVLASADDIKKKKKKGKKMKGGKKGKKKKGGGNKWRAKWKKNKTPK